jgi:AraC-like DNA-binding protein
VLIAERSRATDVGRLLWQPGKRGEKLQESLYSTLAVAAPQRFAYWKEVVCRHCLLADSKPVAQSDFDGQLEVRGFGMLDISTLAAPLHYWERTPQHLRKGPNEDLWLGFTRRGYGQLEQGGRKAALAPDDLFLYDATQTFRFSLGGSENHLVRIPRHLLAARLPSVERWTATVLDDRRPGVMPLREMLRAATSMPLVTQDAGVATRFSQTLLDLLVLSLELQDLQTSHAELDLYGRVMNYIKSHLRDTDLTIERIAQAHHVSTRTVTRAFARHQKTPASVIWLERLRASREAIERGQVRSISQAALDFGFTDFSHFSHAFRKAFGVTPLEILRRR